MPTARKKWLSSWFCVWLWGSRNLIHAHLQISKISNEGTNTSFANWKTECQLLTSDASILGNEGISMLQHFGTNNSAKTTSASQNMELCFLFFISCHSLHPATDSAYVDCSTSINIAKDMLTFVTDSFSATRNSIRGQCLYCTSLMDSVVRHCCSGAICQYLHNFVYKCWELQICFV